MFQKRSENCWGVFRSRGVGLTDRSSIRIRGKAEYMGTLASRYGRSLWKFSSGCFCLVLLYFMN